MTENNDATGGHKTQKPHKSEGVVQPPTHVVVDPPFPAVNVPQPPSKAAQDEPKEKSLPWFIRPDWVIVYVTAIYVFFTWRTLKAIKGQADTMDRQAIEARESSTAASTIAVETLRAIEGQANAARKQADAATQAAEATAAQIELVRRQIDVMREQSRYMSEGLKATQDANALAQKTLLVTQSPFIHITKTTLRPLRIGDIPTVDMEFKNFGKVQADGFGVAGKLIVATTQPDHVIANVATAKLVEFPPDVVRREVYMADSALTLEQFDEIMAGTLKIYMFGFFQFNNPLLLNETILSFKAFCSVHAPNLSTGEMAPCDHIFRLSVPGAAIPGQKAD